MIYLSINFSLHAKIYFNFYVHVAIITLIMVLFILLTYYLVLVDSI